MYFIVKEYLLFIYFYFIFSAGGNVGGKMLSFL